MPLPLPSLDRRTFAELVSEGKSLIPRLAPRWTDHNVHDPGITLLELFAWLFEMDIYRLNRTSEAAQRAFLRLLGIEPRPPQVAEAVVIFTNSSGAVMPVPAGSRVTDAGGATVFQTAHDLNVSPGRITAVFTGREKPESEVTEDNEPDGKHYKPFGLKPTPGDALYLRFAKPLSATAEMLSLYVWAGPPSTDGETRAKLIAEWEAARTELDEKLRDKCVPHWSLHYSARTVWEYLTAGGAWVPLEGVSDETRALTLSGSVRFTAPPDAETVANHRWIRCRLLSGHFECPPEIDAIALNAVLARHEASVAEKEIGKSNGAAGQVFELGPAPVVAGNTTLRVMIDGVADDPWREALVWDLAGPHDRSYVLLPELGEILFGNGRAGRVPPAEAQIFCSHRTGGGPRGNVPAGTLKVAPLPNLTVEQPFAATGGADAETVAEAQARALRGLDEVHRAVTLVDFQNLAIATPGVPVARARALAGHHPAVPCFDAPGCVTVVIVPRCPDERPEPGPDLLAAVHRYLERRRTIATELHVIGPSYTPVVVHARLHAVRSVAATAVRETALKTLNEFLHPLRGGPEGKGWPVGRDVYRSEVLAVLAGIHGVEFVDRFGLQTDGDPEPRCGNIPVCADHLVASGAHQIEVVERNSKV